MKMSNHYFFNAYKELLSFAIKSILSVLVLIPFYWPNSAFSQTENPRGLSINETNADPDPSAIVDISSNSKGLLIPRMSASERLAITVPAEGLVVYDLDENAFFYFSGAEWKELGIAAIIPWNTTGDNIYNSNAGNVGIGTGTPSAKLHVISANSSVASFSNSYGAATLSLNATSGTAALRLTNSAVAQWEIKNINGANRLDISDAGENPVVSVLQGGNTGIGTTIPSAKLHIHTTNTNNLLLKIDQGSSDPMIELITDNTNINRSTMILGGDFTIKGISGGSMRFASGLIVLNGGGTNPVRCDSDLQFGGGKGIKNWAGENVFGFYIGSLGSVINPVRVHKTFALENPSGPHLAGNSNVIIKINNSSAANDGAFKVLNNINTALLTIDNAGNAGIGTSAPSAKLHIGGIAGTDGIRFPDGTLQTTAASGSSQWTPSGNNIYNSNSGNVGIGVLTPSAKFHVDAPTGAGEGIRISGGNVYALKILGDGTNTIGATITGCVNGVSVVSSISNGNGVASTVEQGINAKGIYGYNFDSGFGVFAESRQGTALRVQTEFTAIAAASSANTAEIWRPSTLGSFDMTGSLLEIKDFTSSSGNLITINKQGTDKFVIRNSGNVGIGTNDPIAILDVNGTAKFSGDVTLGSNASLKHSGSASSLSFDATGLSNVTGLGYNLGSSATAQGLVVAPIGTTGYPNGVVALTDPNFDGQIMLSLGSGNTGTRINLSGSEKKIVLQNDGGDKLSMGGVNESTLWESTQGINITPRAGFVNTASTMLYVEGNIVASGTITQNSDITLKKDIVQLENALDKVLQLRGVSYYWKSIEKEQEKQIGLIAQEIEKIYPELVKEDKEGIKSVNYAALVAPLIEAIKEQQKIIDEQKQKIHQLESGNAMMTKQIENLKTMEARLSALEIMMKSSAESAAKK